MLQSRAPRQSSDSLDETGSQDPQSPRAAAAVASRTPVRALYSSLDALTAAIVSKVEAQWPPQAGESVP